MFLKLLNLANFNTKCLVLNLRFGGIATRSTVFNIYIISLLQTTMELTRTKNFLSSARSAPARISLRVPASSRKCGYCPQLARVNPPRAGLYIWHTTSASAVRNQVNAVILGINSLVITILWKIESEQKNILTCFAVNKLAHDHKNFDICFGMWMKGFSPGRRPK